MNNKEFVQKFLDDIEKVTNFENREKINNELANELKLRALMAIANAIEQNTQVVRQTNRIH